MCCGSSVRGTSSDVKTGFFSETGNRFAETGFLPVIERLLSTDYHGISIHKGSNLSAELEYSFKKNLPIYSI